MDADKIQTFIVYNFEKAVVAIVFLLSGFLVYVGMDKEDITKLHDPKKLQDDATEVRNRVDDDHTEAVVGDRIPTFDIAAEQSKFRAPIDHTVYVPSDPLDISKKEAAKVKREDPVLHQPQGIQVVGVVGSMAFRSLSGEYRLTSLEPADPLEIEETKPKPRRERRRRGGGGGMDDGMMMEDMMDMESEMMGMESEMMSPATAGGGRKIDPSYNLGAEGKSTKSLRGEADQSPVPGPGIFIAGTAAIPHKELINGLSAGIFSCRRV